MVKGITAVFLIICTSMLYGQGCENYCETLKFSDNFEIIAPEHIIECNCLDLIVYKLDSAFSDADYQVDVISQKQILDQLDNLFDQKTRTDYSEISIAKYIFDKGLYNKNINNLEYANEQFQEVFTLLKTNYSSDIELAEQLSLALQQLAEISTAKSNFQRSIDYLQYSIQLEEKRVEGTGKKAITHSMLNRIGLNYSMMGDGEEALNYFSLGNQGMKDAILTLSKERLNQHAYTFIGYFSFELEETIKLKKNKESAELIKIISKIQFPVHPRNKAINILRARFYVNTMNRDSAEYYFEKSRDSIFTNPYNYNEKLNYFLHYTSFCETFKSEEEALIALDSAVIFTDKILASSTRWSRNMILAKSEKINLLHKLGRNQEVLDVISKFTKEIYNQLSGAVIFEDHINHINDFYPIFEIGLSIIKNEFPDNLDLAFDILECTKAISLYKSSFLTENSKFSLQDSLILQFKTLNALSSLYTLNQSEGDSSLENRNKLYDTNKLLSKIKSQLLANNPSPEYLTLSKYQEELGRNKSHILSFAGQNKYYFLKIESENSKLLSISKSKLDEELKEYITSISAFENRNYINIASQLGRTMDEIINDSKNQIIFSPDGFLDFVPIESIIMKDGRFLLNTTSISYTPSAKIQHLLNTKNLSKDIKIAIFRPTFSKQEIPLEYAEKECAEVLKIMGGQIFDKELATKAMFLEKSEQFDILHLATHAKSINDDPSKSYINFADSKLYFNEIRSMILNTELVCLSACETNTGINFNGEGVQSLARNFIASGSRSVISSLWNISDQTTSEITISFYKYLQSGKSKSEALQKAKLDFIKNHPDDGIHPYYWAGLILTGNSDELYPSNRRNYLILGSFSILVIGFIVYKSISSNTDNKAA